MKPKNDVLETLKGQREQAEAALRQLKHQEAQYRDQLATLRQNVTRTKQKAMDNTAYRLSGTDLAWAVWAEEGLRSLNTELSRNLAMQNLALAETAQAVGRHEAFVKLQKAQNLRRQKQAEARLDEARSELAILQAALR